jgi:hypothetical protein
MTEKVGDVSGRLQEWLDYYGPVAPGERELCERATVAGVQTRRVLGAQAATLDDQITRARRKYDEELEDELQQSRELLRTDPGRAVLQMKRSALGCRWLLLEFQRLAALLARDGTLYGNDREDLTLYLGGEPWLDRLFDNEGAYLTRMACVIANPNVKDADVQALGGDEIMPLSLREREVHTWLGPKPIFQEWLKQLIEDAIADLTRREELLRVEYEDPGRERAEKKAARLTGEDAQTIARFMRMHELDFHRAHNALLKCLAARGAGTPESEKQNKPNETASPDATPCQTTASTPAEDPGLTSDSAVEQAAERRRDTAAALAPGEANGIGAPILRGDRVLDFTIESRWWTHKDDAPPPGREEGPLVDEKGCRDLAARVGRVMAAYDFQGDGECGAAPPT